MDYGIAHERTRATNLVERNSSRAHEAGSGGIAKSWPESAANSSSLDPKVAVLRCLDLTSAMTPHAVSVTAEVCDQLEAAPGVIL